MPTISRALALKLAWPLFMMPFALWHHLIRPMLHPPDLTGLGPGPGARSLLGVNSTSTEKKGVTNPEECYDIFAGTVDLESEAHTAFSLLLLACLMLLIFITGYVLRQYHVKFLHESGVAILMGMLLGVFVKWGTKAESIQSFATFNKEFFFLFLLPPIIFESGYTMKRRQFFRNIGSIISLAFIGTAFSTIVIGGGMYLLRGLFYSELTFIEAMLFGSLISATDPVTVLAVFKELRVDYDLYSNIFGESVLNDAVAIVLYRTVLQFAGTEFSWSGIGSATLSFFIIFCGSLAIGALMALLAALLFKYLQLYKYPISETVIFVLLVFSSYFLAEGWRLSGIVAILFCGIVMSRYTYNNLSVSSQHLSVELFEAWAMLAETFVFAYLGFGIFMFEQHFSAGAIFVALGLALVGRLHVFPIAWITNIFRRKWHAPNIFTWQFQVMGWYSGLRGAIAFSLAIGLKEDLCVAGVSDDNAATMLLSTTLMMVLITVLGLGAGVVPLLSKLRIRMGDSGDDNVLPGQQPRSKAQSWILDLDKKVKPFFVRLSRAEKSDGHEESHGLIMSELREGSSLNESEDDGLLMEGTGREQDGRDRRGGASMEEQRLSALRDSASSDRRRLEDSDSLQSDE